MIINNNENNIYLILNGASRSVSKIYDIDGNVIFGGGSGPVPPSERDYLYFVSDVPNIIGLQSISSGEVGDIVEYSFDQRTWTRIRGGENVSIDSGQKIYFRGNYNEISGSLRSPRFTTVDECECHGNVMSMLGEDFENITNVRDYGLQGIFQNTKITTAPYMTAVTLGVAACANMFQNTLLVEGPQLTATTLSNDCYWDCFNSCNRLISIPDFPEIQNIPANAYRSMFNNCWNLIATPRIGVGVKTVGNNACSNMFANNRSLETITDLPGGNIGDSGFYEMFYGCNNLKTIPDVTANSFGQNACLEMFRWSERIKNGPRLISANQVSASSFKHMFSECHELVNAPEIRVSTSWNGGNLCENMFLNCRSLTNVPAINISHLTRGIFYNMFKGCTSLVNAPEINVPGVLNSAECMFGMFEGCTSLVNAPEFRWVGLSTSACDSMFKNCTSLVDAPELIATSLGQWAYAHMFNGCVALKNVPDLPECTNIGSDAYEDMFGRCLSLVNAPVIKQINLPSMNTAYYSRMFQNCVSLKYVEIDLHEWSEDYTGRNWLYNVAPGGIVYAPNGASGIQLDSTNGVPPDWILKTQDVDVRDYLRFTPVYGDLTIGFEGYDSYNDFKYSLDGTNWNDFTEPIVVNEGNTIYFKANGLSSDSSDYHRFTTDNWCECHGNIMSLLGEDFENLYEVPLNSLNGLFMDTLIFTAPELPAIFLNEGAYANLFNGTQIHEMPELPAEILPELAYYRMFYNAPISKGFVLLHAIFADDNAYKEMFGDNNSISKVLIYAGNYNSIDENSFRNNCIVYAPNFESTPEGVQYQIIKDNVYVGKLKNNREGRGTLCYKENIIENRVTVCDVTYSGYEDKYSKSTSKLIHDDVLIIRNQNNKFTILSTYNGESISEETQNILMWNSWQMPFVFTCNENVLTDGNEYTFVYNNKYMVASIGWLESGGPIRLVDNIENAAYWTLELLYGHGTEPEPGPEPGERPEDETVPLYLYNTTSSNVSVGLPTGYSNMKICNTTLDDWDVDNINWQNASGTITIPAYSKTYVKADSTSGTSAKSFTITTPIEVHGNVMSLLGWWDNKNTDAVPAYGFNALFKGTSITTAPAMTAWQVDDYGCKDMYRQITTLNKAPEFPAENVGNNAYRSCFNACSGLTIAPSVLPCMFPGPQAYNSMFNGTHITESPEIMAMILDDNSFESMFSQCFYLTKVKCMCAYDSTFTPITDSISSNWLYGVPNDNNCIFYKNPDWSGPTTRGYSTIPSEWQIVDWEQE